MKLLPCPLCGGHASITQAAASVWNIACVGDAEHEHGCGLVLFGGQGEPRMTLVARWNTRPQP